MLNENSPPNCAQHVANPDSMSSLIVAIILIRLLNAQWVAAWTGEERMGQSMKYSEVFRALWVTSKDLLTIMF